MTDFPQDAERPRRTVPFIIDYNEGVAVCAAHLSILDLCIVWQSMAAAISDQTGMPPDQLMRGMRELLAPVDSDIGPSGEPGSPDR